MLFGFGPDPREFSLEGLGRFEFSRFPRVAGRLFAEAFRFDLRCCDCVRQLSLGLLAHLSDLRRQSCVGGGLCFLARKAGRFFALAVCPRVGGCEL